MASAIDIQSYVRNELYIAILGRDPLATGDADGLNYWVQQTINNGWSLDQLRQAWLTSAGITLQQSTQAAREFLAPAIFTPSQPTVTAAPVVTTSPPVYVAPTPAPVPATVAQASPSIIQTVTSLLPTSLSDTLTNLVSPQSSTKLPAVPVAVTAAPAASATGGISPLMLAAAAFFLLRR